MGSKRLIEVRDFETMRVTEGATTDVDLSVVIPTFNESYGISKILRSLHSSLTELQIKFEIILVDDDSPDNTWEIAAELLEEIPELTVIRRVGAKGLATAVICGWQYSNGRLLGVMDGDGQHPVGVVKDLFTVFSDKNNEVAIASRYLPHGGIKKWSLSRRLLSRGAQTLGQLLLPGAIGTINDPMSGFFIVKRSIITKTELDPVGYKILLEILARSQANKIQEVPYVFLERSSGKSKVALSHYSSYLRHLLRLRIQPLRSRALVRYLLVTAGALVLDAVIFFWLFDVNNWNLTRSAALAGEGGILFTILLHDLWTFAGRPVRTLTDRIRRLVGVHLALGALMFLRLLAINAFVNWFSLDPLLAFLLTLTVVMPGGHLLGSRFSWRNIRV
ncbi:MAG: sulfonate ABC transporter permease [Acidimicrobiaceae bacterium]|nr:sulfonate ABC transporter permease [Acidimicrobiaceae bacterium]